MNESQKFLAGMNEKEQEALILRLGRYAVKECRRLNWRTKSSVDLPEGEIVESVVSKAFVKVLSGERKWNLQANPDFTKYMMDVIDSLISHLVNSSDNRMLTTQPDEGSEEETAWHGAAPKHARKHEAGADWMSRSSLSPEDEMMEKERAESAAQAMRLLEDSIAGDEELVAIVKAIRTGCNKNGEIAEHTGIDVRKVEAANKRLDRKTAAINKQLTNSNSA